MFFPEQNELYRARSIRPAPTTIPAEHAGLENFGMICEIAAFGTNSADLKWFEQMRSALDI